MSNNKHNSTVIPQAEELCSQSFCFGPKLGVSGVRSVYFVSFSIRCPLSEMIRGRLSCHATIAPCR
jgi:hypothetical protein